MGEENAPINMEKHRKEYLKAKWTVLSPKYYQFYSFEYFSKYDLFKDYFLVETQFLFRQRKSTYGEYNTAQLLQIIPARILVFCEKKINDSMGLFIIVSLKITSVVWYFFGSQ